MDNETPLSSIFVTLKPLNTNQLHSLLFNQCIVKRVPCEKDKTNGFTLRNFIINVWKHLTSYF